MRLFYLLAPALFVQSTTSFPFFFPADKTRCLISISESLSRISFTGSHLHKFKIDACTNRLRLYSLYAAAKLYCSREEISAGEESFSDDCGSLGLDWMPYASVDPLLTDEYLARLRVLEFGEVRKGEEQDEVVLISEDYFSRGFRTNRAWAYEQWAHHTFGYASYWFWGAALFVGMLHRLSTYVTFFALNSKGNDMEHNFLSPRSRHSIPGWNCFCRWIRANLIIPATIGTYHQRLFYWCSIPTRIESLIISLFYTMSFVLTFIGHDVFEGNFYWPDTFTQSWRYISDRTGTMSYSNLSLIWLFGQRNNAFLPLTGWRFSTFNLFHRAVARVATIQAIVHSIGYTVLTVDTKSYSFYWPSSWWYMGAVGTICMSLLLGFSSIWLRRNYYEIFLLIHIAFSVIILAGLFVHTSIFKGEYDIYLWPVVGIWCLDRSARLVKLFCCNIHIWIFQGKIGLTTTVASYNKASDIVRLDVIPGSRYLRPRPGQYYYIYQPLSWRGYESHPFTLGSSSSTRLKDFTRQRCSRLVPGTPLLEDFGDDASSVTVRENIMETSTNHEDGSEYLKLTFWIRPFDGWTRRLRTECLNSTMHTIHSSFLIEGPYGASVDLSPYENVMLIAGGTGIAAALPHLEEHIRGTSSDTIPRASNGPSPIPSSSSSGALLPRSSSSSVIEPRDAKAHIKPKSITFLWTCRQEGFIHELAKGELSVCLRRHEIKAQFYCTSSHARPKTIDENTALLSEPLDAKPSERLGRSNSYSIIPGRPDIRASIRNNLEDTGDCLRRDGFRSAVLVCGPPGMADEVRAAVHEALEEGFDVEHFEEAFGW